MGVSSVDRLARSKRPTVERTEIHIPPAPVFPVEAVTGDPRMRAQAVAAFNNALQKWRNDAWSIEAPFVPDAELQADVATLEDTMAKLVTKLDRAAVDIRRAEASITTISTNVTNIDNSITTIDNQITVIESNSITGTGIVQANGTGPPTAIIGTQGHVPYWNASGPPYLSATSPIYTDGTNVGIGTDLPVFLLDLGLSGTTAGVIRLAGSASGNVIIQTAAAAGAWTLTLPTTDGAANEFLKTDGTGVTSWSSVVLTTDVTGLLPTANGGTNHGVWTPGSVIFAGAGGLLLTEDNANLFYDDALNRLGVGLAVPLSKLHVAIDDAVTTVTDVLRINHSLNTGGTAANFGTGILLTGETSTTDAQEMARIQTIWTTSTHATRTSALQFQTVNSAAALATQAHLSGDGRLGVGTSITLATNAAYSVYNLGTGLAGVTLTSNITQSNIIGAFKTTLVLAGSGTLDNVRALDVIVNSFNTSVSSVIRGAAFSAQISAASARAALLVGGYFSTVNDATAGTITNVIGIDVGSMTQNFAGSTTTNLYGIRINNYTNVGTITNTYGVWVGDITTGTQTNVAYSFYASDTSARNFFAGNTGMGGGLSVGDGGTTMTLGVVNATIGYRIAGLAANQQYLRGNGTNFVSSSLVMTDASGVLPIANGGTNANAFGTTEGVVYFDGTRLVNSADLFYSGSELVSRGVSLNGINEPYAARNINTGANAGTGYEAEVADTSNNLITAGYITWFKEQSWTTVAATQDSSATIGTTLNGATIAAILLHSSGSVVCGKDATGTTRTDDFTYICQTNGVPTGVPTTFGNRVAMTFDPNTDTFYIYRGGWKGVVLV